MQDCRGVDGRYEDANMKMLMKMHMKMHIKMQIIVIALCTIIALCLMCLAQATSDTTHIRASYSSRLELILPDGDLEMARALPGGEAIAICQVLIRSNVDWQLKVDGEYYGQMQKVTNSKTGIDSKMRLKKPMKFRYAGTDLPPVEKDLSGSAVSYCQGPPGEILVPTEFKQAFSWVDPPARYRMDVTFRLSPD